MMSNKSNDFLETVKEKSKEIDSKLSIKHLMNIVKVFLVGAIIGLSIYTYWNYDHNMGEPSKVKITNKDLREVRKRTLDRWGY